MHVAQWQELWGSRLMVYFSTCMYLGILAHSSFCQPGTLCQLSVSIPNLKPTGGSEAVS